MGFRTCYSTGSIDFLSQTKGVGVWNYLAPHFTSFVVILATFYRLSLLTSTKQNTNFKSSVSVNLTLIYGTVVEPGCYMFLHGYLYGLHLMEFSATG